MDVKKICLKEDITAAARLVYKTDAFVFPLLFGEPQKAVPQIAQLIRLSGNSFSHRFMWRCGESEIEGILIGLMPGDIDGKKERRDFGAVFSLWELVKLGFKNSILNHVMSKPKDGAYIQDVCVDERQRGRGIGSALITHFCNHAAQSGQKRVYLDVDIDNTGARRLYERLGFAVIRKSMSMWFKGGLYQMRKEL